MIYVCMPILVFSAQGENCPWKTPQGGEVSSYGSGMPGPWVAGSDNPGFLPGMAWKVKDVYEVYTYADSGDRQGKLLVEVEDTEAATKDGKWVEVKVIAIEDPYLCWWFSSGDGHVLGYRVRLHVCSGSFEDCKKVRVRKDEFHSDVVRKINVEDIRLNSEAWWMKSGSKANYTEWRKSFLEEHKEDSKPKKKKGRGEDDLDFEPSEDEKEGDGKDKKEGSDEARDGGLKKKLRDLKEHAKKGAKPAKKDRKDKREKERDEKSRMARKRKSYEESTSSQGRDARERSPKRAVWFGKEKKDPKSAKDKVRHDTKKDKKKEKKSTSSTSTSERRKRRKRKRERREDRGPYGSGRRVKYGRESDDSRSDSDGSSVFQGGVPDKKAHQLILQEYAEKRPGRLTARMLQKMMSLMSRSGTPANQLNPVHDRTPPVATPYLLTVILPTYREKVTMRLLRELKTLSYALDFLALGQGERASDILAQRLELVLSDQGWNRAQFLELIPPEGAGLVDPEEQRMASKEQALDAKLKSYLPAGWKKNDGGKGEEKGGKAGKKGKGLGKNDKTDWKKDGSKKDDQKAPSQWGSRFNLLKLWLNSLR